MFIATCSVVVWTGDDTHALFFKLGSCRTQMRYTQSNKLANYASCPCELMHKCINALMLGCLKLNVHFYPVQSKSGPTELLEEIETALCGVVLGGWHCML
jgi:hypothetical protein